MNLLLAQTIYTVERVVLMQHRRASVCGARSETNRWTPMTNRLTHGYKERRKRATIRCL